VNAISINAPRAVRWGHTSSILCPRDRVLEIAPDSWVMVTALMVRTPGFKTVEAASPNK